MRKRQGDILQREKDSQLTKKKVYMMKKTVDNRKHDEKLTL